MPSLTPTIKDGKTYVPVSQLKNWDKNPRGVKKEDFSRLVKQLKKHGQNKPLLVDVNTTEVLGGNMRLRAYRKLGWEYAWVSLVEPKDEAEQIELALADNDNVGYYEEDRLAELVAPHLKTIDLKVYQAATVKPLELGSVVDLFSETGEDDFDMEEEAEAIAEPESKPGEVYELGPHRLMCGDSTDPEQVKKLMGSFKASLFATDPPYLVDYDGTNHPHEWNKAKDAKRDEAKYQEWDANKGKVTDKLYYDFVKVAIENALLERAAFYCWHAGTRADLIIKAWNENGVLVHQQIIWVKDRPVFTRSMYMYQHEPCYYGWQKGKQPQKMTQESPRSVWNIPTVHPGKSNAHPTAKPVEIFTLPMRYHTKRGDICYEPFAGSGSQIIAAEKLGRRCFAMEMSPIYCDVIRKRYAKYTQPSGDAGGSAEDSAGEGAEAPTPAASADQPSA